MSIQLESINFIVPIATIKEKYPRVWDQCLKDHKRLIGGSVWYDDYLFIDGAMNPRDIGYLMDEWAAMGFENHAGGDKPERWIDVCVVEFFGPTLPCN